MSDDRFLKRCAEALRREHGNKAFEVCEHQIAVLHATNPKAAKTWWEISKHLLRPPAREDVAEKSVGTRV